MWRAPSRRSQVHRETARAFKLTHYRNFGEITGTLGGYGNREVQFALRLAF